jgi:hypothetical protein
MLDDYDKVINYHLGKQQHIFNVQPGHAQFLLSLGLQPQSSHLIIILIS